MAEAQGEKGSDGGGEVCLGEEIAPCPLQQKAQVSKGLWVEMLVLSSWRAYLEMRMHKCLLLSWRSCMETVPGLPGRRYRVLADSMVVGSSGLPLPCRHIAKG